MEKLAKTKERIKTSFRTDPNIDRVRSWREPIARRLPSATVDYIVEKLPIAQWLPHYDYHWILNDVVAGITIGVMFIPQGLAYAKIATIPIEHGLYSSWLPSLLYVFLGTSKEISTGPTSILGLLTAEAVSSLKNDGHSPAEIASAVAFMVGVFALAVGLLKLGFLLDFVSGPVLTGWISAVALVILLGQVGSLVGLEVGSGVPTIIRGVLGHLGKIKPMTLCIGLTSILMLLILEHVGKRWGKKSKWIKFAGTSRAVIVLFIYTLISYLVNKNLDEKHYKWAIIKVNTHGLIAPRAHDSSLLRKVLPRSFAPFIAMAVEHLGVGKAFGLRNGYSIDKSQELVFLGANNIVNSLFGAMATGGAMSRTAVNSECGVNSPLNFIFTAGFVVLTLFELAPALYWIPKATLSAIIIMAVAHLVSPPRLFYRYWRMSFIDFIASMLGFWVTLFTSTEIGLATAVGFSILYTLLRLAFPRWAGVTHSDTENNHCTLPQTYQTSTEIDVPAEAYLVRFTDDILFPNADRIKNAILEDVKVRYEPVPSSQAAGNGRNRTWNSATTKRIRKTRRRQNITPIMCESTPLRHVVLDFGMVAFIDTTGLLTLIELKAELRKYIGKDLQFRFVGMVDPVHQRFLRSEWEFSRPGEERKDGADVIYTSLQVALLQRDGDEKDDPTEKVLDV